MTSFACHVVLALMTVAGAQGLPPVPYAETAPSSTVGGLRLCTAGETTYRLDASGHVRSVAYARLIPDNTLRVRQSYDRAGRLTGASVQWSGFAGPLLDLRGSFDARGRLVKESGFRASGLTAPLTSYLRPRPAKPPC